MLSPEDMPCSERTFCRYVDEGKAPVIALDLVKKVKYKRRKKRAAPSVHEKGFYKGCEKNHVELRKVLPKGISLDKLDAATLTEICCHVNSTVGKGCGDVSPMQLAQLVFPKEMVDNLGLDLIPPREVISVPGVPYDPDRVW